MNNFGANAEFKKLQVASCKFRGLRRIIDKVVVMRSLALLRKEEGGPPSGGGRSYELVLSAKYGDPPPSVWLYNKIYLLSRL